MKVSKKEITTFEFRFIEIQEMILDYIKKKNIEMPGGTMEFRFYRGTSSIKAETMKLRIKSNREIHAPSSD